MNKTLYISPDGCDSNAGTQDAPLATLAAALKKASRGDTVVLADGVYHLTETVKIDESASGITVCAAPGTRPVISGGRTLSGWTLEKDGLWSASVPWMTSRENGFRQLVVNGELRPRSRLPKQGFFTAATLPLPEGADWNLFCHNTLRDRIEIKEGDISPDWNLINGEVIFYHYWVDSHVIPRSVVTEEGRTWLELDVPLRRTPSDSIYRVENLREIISEPGEWALDYTDKKVYYKPIDGEKMEDARAVVPFVERLMEICGARDLAFRGIAFEDSKYELPHGERNDLQASNVVSAAITLEYADNCTFGSCSFRHLSGFALDFLAGVRNCRITKSSLTSLGAGGVRMSIPNAYRPAKPFAPWEYEMPAPRDRVVGNEISDCEIADFGRDFYSAVGVLIMSAEGTKVCHNSIHDGYYTGVSVGWTWGYQPSPARDNEIDFNHIYNIGKGVLSDMGAVYTLGVSPGTKIRNNLVHDIDARHYGGWGLYNDEGSTGILLENNIVYNTKFSCYHMHFGRDCTVRNNIFAGGRIDQLTRSRREAHTSLFLYGNIIFWKEGVLHTGQWEDDEDYRLPNFPGREIIMRKTTECDYNLYFNPNMKLEDVKWGTQQCSFEDWRGKYGQDAHSLWADPLFADPEKHDYTLDASSPAFKLGFTPIDMTSVGPRK